MAKPTKTERYLTERYIDDIRGRLVECLAVRESYDGIAFYRGKSIVRQKVNGKERHYLVWRENGKRKKKYISAARLDEYKALIERERFVRNDYLKLEEEIVILGKIIDHYDSFI